MMSPDPWTYSLALFVVGLFGFLWKRNGSKGTISADEQREIERILRKSPNAIVANHAKESLSVRVRDLCTLREGEWLNDEVINFYFALLADRNSNILFLNSFFWTKLTANGYNYSYVKRWTKVSKLRKKGIEKNHVFEMDKVIFPINVRNNHWCCGCIDIKNKRFEFYDSLHGSASSAFRIMRRYLMDEHEDKIFADNETERLNLNEWTDNDGRRKYAKQQNYNDCGVFTLKCAEFLSQAKYPHFTQGDMPYFRKQIMISIINGAI